MKFAVSKSQNVSQNCLVCGTENPLGLKARFYETDKNEVIAVFRPINEHQSYPQIMHGGISAAALDETIGRAIMAHSDNKTFGVTVELTVQYKKPIPLDAEIKVVGRITKNRGRLFEGTGELFLPNGEIAVEAKGKYMKRRLAQITNLDFEANEWFSPKEPSPKELLI